VLRSGPRHGRSRWKLDGWSVGVASSRDRDGCGRGFAGERRRQQHHHLRYALLSRRHHRRTRWRWKKHIPMGSVQFARRHRTGLGLFCLAEGRNCRSARKSQTTKARSTGEILALPNRRNTYTVPLVRGRAVDKLGMMRCVVCQAGSFQVLAPSPVPAPSAGPANAISGGSPQRRDRLRRRCRASRLELHSRVDSSQPYSTFT
jgi:hypothetical protein